MYIYTCIFKPLCRTLAPPVAGPARARQMAAWVSPPFPAPSRTVPGSDEPCPASMKKTKNIGSKHDFPAPSRTVSGSDEPCPASIKNKARLE